MWARKNGIHSEEQGECVASVNGLGHSCWAIAGTLCGGEVSGSKALKDHNCHKCDVYLSYNRIDGSLFEEVVEKYTNENKKYVSIMMDQHFIDHK